HLQLNPYAIRIIGPTYQEVDVACANEELLRNKRPGCCVPKRIFSSTYPVIPVMSYWIRNIPVVSTQRHWTYTGGCYCIAAGWLILERIAFGCPARQIACLEVPIALECEMS